MQLQLRWIDFYYLEMSCNERQTCNVFVFTFIKHLIKRKDVLHIGCLVEKVINHIALIGFTTNRGLLLHLNVCRKKEQEQQNQQFGKNDDQENTHRLQDTTPPTRTSKRTFLLEEEARPTTFINELNNMFDSIVYRRKTFLPTEAVGKSFINEMTQINPWVCDTPIKNIALKALHVMPAWLMQKPSKNSK